MPHSLISAISISTSAALEALFDHARAHSLTLGVTGSVLRRALRGEDPLDRVGDIDVALPSGEDFGTGVRWHAWLKELAETASPLKFDPVGVVDPSGGFCPRPLYHLSEPLGSVLYLQDGTLSAPDPASVTSYQARRIQLTNSPWSLCQPLRLIRLETEAAGFEVEESVRRRMREYGRNVFRSPHIRARLTLQNAKRLGRELRRSAPAGNPLFRFAEWCRSESVSAAALREVFGVERGRALFHEILSNAYHRLPAHLERLFEHAVDSGRVLERLQEYGWSGELELMGYDLERLATRRHRESCPVS